ncbi:hypothetical protein VTO73DRAFT_3778 [Trametes versicolor]
MGDRHASEQYSPSNAVVMPGRYTLLAPDRTPIHINLVATNARRRQTTIPRVKKGELNLHHARERDRKSTSPVTELSWCKLQAAHIFSAPHPSELERKVCFTCVTRAGTAPTPRTSPSAPKHASLQNMLLLREDLHGAWADYEFGIDPDDGYRITAFVSGHDTLAGRVLQPDEISDPATRPLDQPLRDHFLQGLLKHVKGRGERHWDFRSGALDLSDVKVWGTKEGKERLELELENRLFDHRFKQSNMISED